jgi:hypothetical protein
MIYVEHPPDGPRKGRILGLDVCPGIDERGHGLTMAILHDSTCCAEWEAGETPWPRRAAEWRKIAGRRGSTWPQPAEAS